MENKIIKIRNPNAIRPWQFVLEPLGGYLLLAEKLWQDGPQYAQAWNFGPDKNDSKKVSWILDKISEQYNGKMRWELENAELPHEASFLRLDCTKAKKRLGWSPRTNLETALKLTTDWYKQYEQKNDLQEFTKKQINYFSSL